MIRQAPAPAEAAEVVAVVEAAAATASKLLFIQKPEVVVKQRNGSDGL